MQVKAVLFDLFDTLLLLEKDEAYYEPSLRKLHDFLVRNRIRASFEDFKRVYFEVKDELYTEIAESLKEPHFNVRISQVLQRFGYNFDVSNPIVIGGTIVFADEFIRYVSLDDDALDVLRKLSGRCKLGLVTNFAIPECVWKLLDKFGLREFFDVVLVSAEINTRKPSPEIFERALKMLSVNASKAVVVGDTPGLDVEGAKNAGIRAILIERRPTEEIVGAEPDRVISSLKELFVLLEDC